MSPNASGRISGRSNARGWSRDVVRSGTSSRVVYNRRSYYYDCELSDRELSDSIIWGVGGWAVSRSAYDDHLARGIPARIPPLLSEQTAPPPLPDDELGHIRALLCPPPQPTVPQLLNSLSAPPRLFIKFSQNASSGSREVGSWLDDDDDDNNNNNSSSSSDNSTARASTPNLSSTATTDAASAIAIRTDPESGSHATALDMRAIAQGVADIFLRLAAEAYQRTRYNEDGVRSSGLLSTTPDPYHLETGSSAWRTTESPLGTSAQPPLLLLSPPPPPRRACYYILAAVAFGVAMSFGFALWWAHVYGDVSAGFTVGGYLVAVDALGVAVAGVMHRPGCRCWVRGRR